MVIKPLDLTGGKSVYCFNQHQLDQAFQLAAGPEESGQKIRAEVERLEQALTRNERAALAFVIIDKLNKTAEI
jgi:hypothetical protein